MSKKQRLKRRIVFLLVLASAVLALGWMFSALNSPSQQIQQLALKLLSLAAIGSGLVMTIAMLSHVEEPRHR